LLSKISQSVLNSNYSNLSKISSHLINSSNLILFKKQKNKLCKNKKNLKKDPKDIKANILLEPMNKIKYSQKELITLHFKYKSQ